MRLRVCLKFLVALLLLGISMKENRMMFQSILRWLCQRSCRLSMLILKILNSCQMILWNMYPWKVMRKLLMKNLTLYSRFKRDSQAVMSSPYFYRFQSYFLQLLSIFQLLVTRFQAYLTRTMKLKICIYFERWIYEKYGQRIMGNLLNQKPMKCSMFYQKMLISVLNLFQFLLKQKEGQSFSMIQRWVSKSKHQLKYFRFSMDSQLMAVLINSCTFQPLPDMNTFFMKWMIVRIQYLSRMMKRREDWITQCCFFMIQERQIYRDVDRSSYREKSSCWEMGWKSQESMDCSYISMERSELESGY